MLGAALFLISTLPTLLIILFSPMILINCAAKEGSEKAKKASKEKDNSAKAVKPGNVKPNPKVEGSGATSAEASTKKKMASNSNEKPAPTQVAVPTITDKRTTQVSYPFSFHLFKYSTFCSAMKTMITIT